jgi:hypothetical protein
VLGGVLLGVGCWCHGGVLGALSGPWCCCCDDAWAGYRAQLGGAAVVGQRQSLLSSQGRNGVRGLGGGCKEGREQPTHTRVDLCASTLNTHVVDVMTPASCLVLAQPIPLLTPCPQVPPTRSCADGPSPATNMVSSLGGARGGPGGAGYGSLQPGSRAGTRIRWQPAH